MQGYVSGCLGGGGGMGIARRITRGCHFFIPVVSRPHSSVLFHRLAPSPITRVIIHLSLIVDQPGKSSIP